MQQASACEHVLKQAFRFDFCIGFTIGADTVAMVIEGTAPVEALESNKVISNKSSSKPFAFIERTWEVKNPTEEEVGL